MATRIQLRRDTAANWTSANPTLAQGEIGYETDTGFFKIGDGSTPWTTLGYRLQNPVSANTIDAKGDLLVGTADNTVARLAVGADGTVLTADAASAGGVKWATPTSGSLTWTQQSASTTIGANGIISIAYNGSNLYIAAGNSGVMYSSPDAKTWTARTSGFGAQTIYKVAYGNGLWVAVGTSGTITTSSDGITWTARTSNMGSNDIYDVSYDNSLWVAVGAGGTFTGAAGSNTGGIVTSSNGTTWTKQSLPTNTPSTYSSIAYGGTYWVAVGDAATSQNGVYSSNGTTWTGLQIGSTGTTQSISHVRYANSTWFYWDANAGVPRPYCTTASPPTTGGNVVANAYLGRPANQYFPSNVTVYGNYIYVMSENDPYPSIQKMNSALVNTNYAKEVDVFTVPYTRRQSSASTLASLQVQSFYAGPAGFIMGGKQGEIWTSF